MISVSISVSDTPIAFTIFGTKLLAVIPGVVFTSSITTSSPHTNPSMRTMPSHRRRSYTSDAIS